MTFLTRRSFIASATAAVASPAFASSTVTLDYAPDNIKDELARGRTLIVAYHAYWCSVCARQERVIRRLRDENKAYNDLRFIRVDWDEYKYLPVVVDREIPMRSTMILLKGDEEISRLVAATGRRNIQAFLDTGLELATS